MPPDPERIDIFLQPGELFVGDAGFRIRTVLGSCVSITLWHPAACIGGMSHFLLPSRCGLQAPVELDGRYGDEALQMMLGELRGAGVDPGQCRAKIFGGGNMFAVKPAAGVPLVGQRNGQAARRLLQEQGIPVVSESLFGWGHRQVIFDIASGDVWLHQVRPAALAAAAAAAADPG